MVKKLPSIIIHQSLFIVIFSFLVWRIILFLIAFLAPFILLTFGNRFPYVQEVLVSTGFPSWLWSWGNFDGVHYLRIAQDGYNYQFTQAFFPLYPILIGFVSSLFGLSHLIIGILISNVSFLAALIVFWKLLEFDFSKARVKRIILLLLFFPTSFFFGSIYTEGLFLFLVVLCFYFARKGDFFLAGIIGALASATRLFGILLLPAILIEFWLVNKERFSFSNFFMLIRQGLPIFLILGGFLGYVWYLWQVFGDPLYFWHAQPIFGAERAGSQVVFPLQVFWRYIKIFLTVPMSSLAFFNASFEFMATVLALAVLIWGFKKIRLSHLVFSFLAVFLPIFSGTFSSMPRYILVAFPVFVVLSQIKNRILFSLLLTIFGILTFVSVSLFTRGYWVA